MNIPIVSRLQGAGVATQTLVGNEEKIDNYGMRVRIEWARNAVVTTKAEFIRTRPTYSEWQSPSSAIGVRNFSGTRSLPR